MNQEDNKAVYKELASDYDNQVKEYDSYGHDVIFGMCFDYVNPTEKLLDVGIGTGLASIKFSRLGLEVFGLDSSPEMLNACRSKSFVKSLDLYDMKGGQIPYEDHYFNHVICCGAIHFLSDLDNLFREIRRVIKPGGIFAFTVAPQKTKENVTKEDTSWGVPIFRHSMVYIIELFEKYGFSLLKEQRLLIKGADKINYDMLFSVLVGRAIGLPG